MLFLATKWVLGTELFWILKLVNMQKDFFPSNIPTDAKPKAAMYTTLLGTIMFVSSYM